MLISALLGFAAGCTPRVEAPAREAGTAPVDPAATSSATDTALGRIAIVGPDPVSWVAVVESDGTQLRLEGSGAAPLRSLSGADVLVRGMRTGNALRVESFVVRRVNGAEVDDGILVVADAGGARLRVADGVERAVPEAPPGLLALGGARVWVSRPVRGVTPSYGVITPRH